MSKWMTYRRRGSAHDLSIVSGYVSRIAAAGGTISDATVAAVNTLVQQLQAADLWQTMHEVWPCAGNQLAAARVKLKVAPGTANAYTSVNIPGGDYAESGASGGLLFNGSNNYLSGGCFTNTLALNSCLWFNALALAPGAGNRWLGGAYNATEYYFVGSLSGAVSQDARLGGSPTASLASVLTAGDWAGSRTAANFLGLYKNGTLQVSSASVSASTTIALQIAIGAANNNGAFTSFMNSRMAGHCAGTGLTAAQLVTLSSIWATFNAALGR